MEKQPYQWEFKLTKEEAKKLAKWQAKIVEKRGSSYAGAIGGALTFIYTPTSIGEIIEVKYFGKKKTLRNIS